METPQGTDTDRAKLDQWMDQRRQELRLRWSRVAELAGMTTPNLLRIRKGQIGISWEAADGIDDALQWERGSVNGALNGEPPRPIVPTVDAGPAAPNPSVSPRVGTVGDLRRGLAYFHMRFKDTPEDYDRLLALLDLAVHLELGATNTQSSTQTEAHG